MRNLKLLILLLGIGFVLILSGCQGMEENVRRAAEDPKQLPAAYMSVASVVFLLLFFFSHGPLLKHLVDTIRYMGVACVVGGPLFWLSSGDASAAGALCFAGVASAVLVTLVFRKEISRWNGSDKRITDSKD